MGTSPSRPVVTAAWLGILTVLAVWPQNANAVRRHYAAHVVQRGESLSKIAKKYECSVRDIKDANGIQGAKIHRGEALAIPPCGRVAKPTKPSSQRSGRARHRVARGESLSRIARQYGCSTDDLRARNQIKGSVIYPGQELVIPANASKIDSLPVLVVDQSVGRPQKGRLVNATRFNSGKGYFLRRKERTYGTLEAVTQVREAISAVRSRFPKLHRLAIGDFSTRHGGPLSGHRSHQSGRDVDLGLYYVKRPKGYPAEFIPGSEHNLDFAATWAMVEALTKTAGKPGGVERIFLDYSLQKSLYSWGRKHKVSRTKLRKILQYPRGRWSDEGVVQHFPNHHDHLHVRFHCARTDKACQ